MTGMASSGVIIAIRPSYGPINYPTEHTSARVFGGWRIEGFDL